MLLLQVNRFAILTVFGAICSLSLLAQGLPDPVFSTVPFERWLTETNQTHFRWTVRVPEPGLSSHQRLAARVEVEVDGAELAVRRGRGDFRVFVQIDDKAGLAFQTHRDFDLEGLREGIKGNNVVFTQPFFVVPGDYRVAVAAFDTATGEHSAVKRNLRVSPLKKDPLPGMWRDLPAIEFIEPESDSGRWYLPSIAGRLHLPVKTRHPIDVALLVNLTPPERSSGSTRVWNRSLGVLLPATKVLSQADWSDATFNLELLDLARRRVTFRQENLRALDWTKAGNALDGVNPGIIDVKSLADRRHNADFFLDRVGARIGAEKNRRPRVVIVLSGLVFFEPGVEMHPIATAPRSDVLVIYIRYRTQPPVSLNSEGRRRGYGPEADELEPLLKPLEPWLFDVATPAQFRTALAAIMARIAEL